MTGFARQNQQPVLQIRGGSEELKVMGKRYLPSNGMTQPNRNSILRPIFCLSQRLLQTEYNAPHIFIQAQVFVYNNKFRKKGLNYNYIKTFFQAKT